MAVFRESYNIAERDLTKFVDQMQRAKFGFGLDPKALEYTTEYLGPILHTLKTGGLDASTGILALAGTMSQAGLKGSILGTGLRAILERLPDLGQHGRRAKEAAKELKGMGLTMTFFDQKSGQFLGMRNFIAQLEKLNVLNPQKRLIALKALFGAEAMGVAALIGDQGVKGFDRALGTMGDQANLDERMRKVLTTQKSGWDAFTGTMDNAAAAMGKAMKPMTGPLLESLNTFANWLQKVATAHPVLVQVIAVLIAVAAAVAAVIAVLAGLGAAFLAIQIGLGVFAAVVGIGLGPVLLILAAVAAAIIAVVWAVNQWDSIVAFVSGVWSRVKAVVAEFVAWLRGIDWAGIGLAILHGIAGALLGLPALVAGAAASLAAAVTGHSGTAAPAGARSLPRVGGVALAAGLQTASLVAGGAAGVGLAPSVASAGTHASVAGPVQLHYNPVIHLAPGTSADVRGQMDAVTRQHSQDVRRIVHDVIREDRDRQDRTAFRR